jgi:hypothetical protein
LFESTSKARDRVEEDIESCLEKIKGEILISPKNVREKKYGTSNDKRGIGRNLSTEKQVGIYGTSVAIQSLIRISEELRTSDPTRWMVSWLKDQYAKRSSYARGKGDFRLTLKVCHHIDALIAAREHQDEIEKPIDLLKSFQQEKGYWDYSKNTVSQQTSKIIPTCYALRSICNGNYSYRETTEFKNAIGFLQKHIDTLQHSLEQNPNGTGELHRIACECALLILMFHEIDATKEQEHRKLLVSAYGILDKLLPKPEAWVNYKENYRHVDPTNNVERPAYFELDTRCLILSAIALYSPNSLREQDMLSKKVKVLVQEAMEGQTYRETKNLLFVTEALQIISESLMKSRLQYLENRVEKLEGFKVLKLESIIRRHSRAILRFLWFGVCLIIIIVAFLMEKLSAMLGVGSGLVIVVVGAIFELWWSKRPKK